MADLIGPVLHSIDQLRTDLRADLGSVRDQLQTYHDADSKAREDMLIRIDRLERWKEEHEAIEIAQAERIAQLENPESQEKRFFDRHPFVGQLLLTLSGIGVCAALLKWAPSVAAIYTNASH